MAKHDTTARKVGKVAGLAGALFGQGPIRVKHTATDIRTGEVLAVSFWEPRNGCWQVASPDDSVN